MPNDDWLQAGPGVPLSEDPYEADVQQANQDIAELLDRLTETHDPHAVLDALLGSFVNLGAYIGVPEDLLIMQLRGMAEDVPIVYGLQERDARISATGGLNG